MTLPIATSNPVNAVGTVPSPRQLSIGQSTAAVTSTTIASVTTTPTANHSVALQSSLKALSLQAGLADDLQSVASALEGSMRTIVEQRPDLATASFDFKSNDGSIQVVSSTLSGNDKDWIQRTLNANGALVTAVNAFHDDAVQSYGLWAAAAGQSSAAPHAGDVSVEADQAFGFMSMFQNASHAWSQSMDPQGHYATSNGAPIARNQAVNSALGFLVFQKSNEAIQEGTDSYTTSTGHTFYGALKGNVFGLPNVIPQFMPGDAFDSVGLSVSA